LPQKFSDPSWAAARIIGPDSLADSLGHALANAAGGAVESGAAPTGEEQHNDDRENRVIG
jgi:hypothetical protein